MREKGDEPALGVALAHGLWNVAYMQAELDQGEASLATTQRAAALVEHVLSFGPDASAEYLTRRPACSCNWAMALRRNSDGIGRRRKPSSRVTPGKLRWAEHDAGHRPTACATWPS